MIKTILKRIVTRAFGRIYNLPVLVLMPHSRCNCRCVMCDIWKANSTKNEISSETLQRHLNDFVKLGVREVVLSGGEPLMHQNLWALCSLLKKRKIRVTLLSTGLLLEKNAKEIIDNCDEVIISVDGSEAVHDKIRNIPSGFSKMIHGVEALKALDADYKITARCVLQRHNYDDFFNIVEAIRASGLSQISFLPADVSSAAFNHALVLTDDRVDEIALNKEETIAFEQIIARSFQTLHSDYASGLIAESPKKMQKLVDYYKAINGLSGFPVNHCNAPWISSVIESDGRVMPCFFHAPYGNLASGESFEQIINSQKAIEFRNTLDINRNPICAKCVCTLKLGLREMH